jgi:hypothetical protein
MDKNQKVFRIVTVIFVLVMIGIGIFLVNSTVSPWAKEKAQETQEQE